MAKLILEMMLSYGDYCYAELKKEMKGSFVIIPGMEIEFPEKTHIGTVRLPDPSDDFFDCKWDMEENTVKIWVADHNTKHGQRKEYIKKLRGLAEDGWELVKIVDCRKREEKMILDNWEGKKGVDRQND